MYENWQVCLSKNQKPNDPIKLKTTKNYLIFIRLESDIQSKVLVIDLQVAAMSNDNKQNVTKYFAYFFLKSEGAYFCWLRNKIYKISILFSISFLLFWLNFHLQIPYNNADATLHHILYSAIAIAHSVFRTVATKKIFIQSKMQKISNMKEYDNKSAFLCQK